MHLKLTARHVTAVRYPLLVSLQSPDKLFCLSLSGVSCDQAWSQAAFKEGLAGVSSILLQQLEVFFTSPLSCSFWTATCDGLLGTSFPWGTHGASCSEIKHPCTDISFLNRDRATKCQWCWNTWLHVPQTLFLLRSVSEGQSILKPVPLGLKTTEDNVSLPP